MYDERRSPGCLHKHAREGRGLAAPQLPLLARSRGAHPPPSRRLSFVVCRFFDMHRAEKHFLQQTRFVEFVVVNLWRAAGENFDMYRAAKRFLQHTLP